MIIAIAPDKYKGTLSSRQAAEAMREGVLAVCPDAEIHIVPMADGGEGTAEIIAPEMGYARYEAVIHAPVEGLPLTTSVYYYHPENKTVLFDSATAIGLSLVPAGKQDIMRTSSAPVGELLSIVQERHDVRQAIIGLGGTANCDAGLGMVLYMSRFKVHMPQIVGLYDAGVPLLAHAGKPSALTFAPQKGADADDMAMLEMRLRKAIKMMPEGDPDTPGAGSAGGLGFAILAMGGKLMRGVDIVAGDRISVLHPDLVITGEGRIDRQSAMGKVLSYFIEYHRTTSTPVIAIGGCVDADCTISTDSPASPRGNDLTAIIAADSYEPRDVHPITPEVAAWRIREAIVDRLKAYI